MSGGKWLRVGRGSGASTDDLAAHDFEQQHARAIELLRGAKTRFFLLCDVEPNAEGEMGTGLISAYRQDDVTQEEYRENALDFLRRIQEAVDTAMVDFEEQL